MNRLAILFLSFGLLGVTAPGQTVHPGPVVSPKPAVAQQLAQKVTPKAPYDSTLGQLYASRLENIHFEFEQARTKMAQDFQIRFDSDKKMYDMWTEGVCKANGWDCKEYQYNPGDDTWYHVLPQTSLTPVTPATPATPVPPAK